MQVGRFLLRVTVGSFFIGHGTQKLFGWFGGHGLTGTGQFFDSVGLRPGRQKALAAGMAETGGGTLLVLGLATPAAAAGLTAVMLTAIRTVHLPNGPWNSDGGYEYNAVLIAAALALADLGPGDWSLDATLGIERRGARWALAALVAGAAGSRLATAGQAPSSPAEPIDNSGNGELATPAETDS